MPATGSADDQNFWRGGCGTGKRARGLGIVRPRLSGIFLNLPGLSFSFCVRNEECPMWFYVAFKGNNRWFDKGKSTARWQWAGRKLIMCLLLAQTLPVSGVWQTMSSQEVQLGQSERLRSNWWNGPSGLWQPIVCNWRPRDLGRLPERGDELENHCCHRRKMGLNFWKIRGIICSLEGSTSSKGSFLMKSLHLIYLTYNQC